MKPQAEVLSTLYRSRFRRLVRFFTFRTGDPSEAEDLASDVFLRAWCALAANPAKAHWLAETRTAGERWLFAIARNMAVDVLRRRGRRPAQVPLEEAVTCQGGTDLDDHVEQRQRLAELRGALRELTPSQREAVTLSFDAELPASEVGRLMDKKPGAVREMKSAALRRLRQLLVDE